MTKARQFQNPIIGRFYEQHFALFFMPAALLDDAGLILHWNRHAERISSRSEDDMRGTDGWLTLLSSRKGTSGNAADWAALLPLFLRGDVERLEKRLAPAHILKDAHGNLTIFDFTGDPAIILCGRWFDKAAKKGAAREYRYLACATLRDYDFTTSPAVPLYEVLKGLDRKRPAWFGIQQDERYCYLSSEMIALLYGDHVAMTDLIDAPLAQTMSEAAAADHARTLAALDCGHDSDRIMNWPHQNAEHISWMQSFPLLLPVNGRPVNFSLVRDISAQKERDSSLENLLLSCNIGVGDRALREHLSDFAGISSIMRSTLANIVRAALSLVTVSIRGETGTGKSQAARLMHSLSSRADGPFIYVNCGAIPDELFESSFFGHVRGAFTGAVRDADGLLTRADQGTLFLDEIAELSPRAQAKLLQALSEKTYTPVGSTRELSSKFRLIAATNRDLENLVRRGLFREDLFYRINVMEVTLPPLRERREDIPLIVGSILRRNGISRSPSRADLDLLEKHGWPGNIRELENVILRYAAEGNLNFFHPLPFAGSRPAFFSEETSPSPEDTSLKELLAAKEREIIIETLNRHRWNKGRAAAALGISRPTLFRKMRAYGLLDDDLSDDIPPDAR